MNEVVEYVGAKKSNRDSMTQNVEDTLPLKPLNFNKRIQVFYKVCTYSAGVFVKISSLSESIITSSMSSTTSTILENVQSI